MKQPDRSVDWNFEFTRDELHLHVAQAGHYETAETCLEELRGYYFTASSIDPTEPELSRVIGSDLLGARNHTLYPLKLIDGEFVGDILRSSSFHSDS